jgi:hypothetical protein
MAHNITAQLAGPHHFPDNYKKRGDWEFVKHVTLFDNLKRAKAKAEATGASAPKHDPYASRRILTDGEDKALVQWCLDAAAVLQPKDRSQMRRQIRAYLMLRKRQNIKKLPSGGRNPHYRKNAEVLSDAAVQVLLSQSVGPSDCWFRESFYAKHPELSEKAECVENAIRKSAVTAKKAMEHLDTIKLDVCNLPVAFTVFVAAKAVATFLEQLTLKDTNVLRGDDPTQSSSSC